MAADLRLIVHAAEAHAPELKSERPGDALAERGLAHARRSDEAQDRAAALRVELAHREKLEDAALDLLEPVVILVEYLTGALDVDVLGVGLGPGHGDQPVEIGARHAVLGACLVHAVEPLELRAPALRLPAACRRR